MNDDSMKNAEDAFEMRPEYDFASAVRGRFYSPHKVSTTIRLDDDIVLYFKKRASEDKIGYQTLMNQVLRDYMNHRLG